MAKMNFTIFKPTTKDMKAEYPELSTVPEFNELNRNSELAFVWYFANKSSDLIDIEPKLRVAEALKLSKLDASLTIEDRRNYNNLVFPADIKRAIDKMATYIPSLRYRAKIALETMFDNVEDMTHLDDKTKRAMTVSDRKEYVILVQKSMEAIEGLVPQIESSFGVKEAKRKVGEKAPETFMDQAIKGGNSLDQ